MPITRLLQSTKFGPDEIEIMTKAFDQALRSLSVVDRNDPLTESLARKIIEIGATSIRDPVEIARMAVKNLRIT